MVVRISWHANRNVWQRQVPVFGRGRVDRFLRLNTRVVRLRGRHVCSTPCRTAVGSRSVRRDSVESRRVRSHVLRRPTRIFDASDYRKCRKCHAFVSSVNLCDES